MSTHNPYDSPRPHRTVIHIDLDAFFAAVEVLDNPWLKGKPVVVGGTPEGRGVVATADYEARRYGIRSAMLAAEAKRRCPHAVFLRPRMDRYAAASKVVFDLLREYTPLVEPVSIDEAFLDVTGVRPRAAGGGGAGEALAREIQRRVREATGGLTASLGVAACRFVAKVASDLEKPEGLVVVPPGGEAAFLAPLPIERLWGVGPKTAPRLRACGLATIGDVQKLAPEALARLVGAENAARLRALAFGIDPTPVRPGGPPRSVSAETTFAVFIPPGDTERIETVLLELSGDVGRRLRRAGLTARTITLKVRDERFRTRTRSRTLERPAFLDEEIYEAARSLWAAGGRTEGGLRVRLLGVQAGGLLDAGLRQLDLFASEDPRKEDFERALDRIREKLGPDAIVRARLLARPEARAGDTGHEKPRRRRDPPGW